MKPNLTQEDVERLLVDPSPESRALLAPKLANEIDSSRLTPEERQLAEDIVRLMVKDASLIVREALAVSLKAAKQLPRDVALTMARDIDQVALPILEFSKVLSDSDLIELIRSAPDTKRTAIARRSTVSDRVADALVESNSPVVVQTLLANEGATLTESTLGKVVERFGDDEEIQRPLVKRAKLPLTIAERLVTRVSDALRDYLVAHHELSTDTASELVLGARERATVDLASVGADQAAIERMVAQLQANGRLTPTLIFRGLCTGDITFFEIALATLAQVPLTNARLLIHDAGQLGLKSIYQKAKLPESLYPAVRTGVAVVADTDFRGADYDRESFSRTMLERILTQCDDLHPDDAEYLLRKLNDLAPAHYEAA